MSLLPTIGAVDQDTGFYNSVATQSLRFNRADSPELSYTPSAGDRRTYTISTWVKVTSNLDQYRAIFGAGGGGNRDRLQLFNNQKLVFNINDGTDAALTTNAVFRDVSSWYHIVAILDSTNGTNASKMRLYVNGTEQTYSASSYPSQNYEGRINTNIEHFIGNSSADNLYLDGYLSEFNFIEGQSLKPEAFGETKNGVWIPKKYETKPSLIAQNAGSAIGDMTGQGGLAGAFNGTRFQAYSASAAQTGSQATSYIGKNWSGSSKTVTGFILYSNTQYGFVGSGASTFTVKLYGKDGSPSNSTDGTLLFTSSNAVDANSRGAIRYFADTNIQSEETISNFTTTTAFTYHWVVITPNASEGAFVSEIEFYEDGSTYYGANGFRMKFNASGLNTSSGAVSSPTNIGDDSSGNNNHLTPTNLVASDCNMPDSPENNFCTLNPLYMSAGTLTEGNLRYDNSAWNEVASTFGFSSGKWYFEVRFDAYNASAEALGVGIREVGRKQIASGSWWHRNTWSNVTNGYVYGVNVNGTTEYKITGGSETSIESSAPEITANVVVGIAIDLDSSTTSIKYNVDGGTLFTLFEDMEALTYHPAIDGYQAQATINFGQDSSFAGQETATSKSDANGNGTFHSDVPSGYLALCSANLEEPTIGPNSDTQATDHFNTALWDGNSGTQDVVVGFKPDWVWIKVRNTTYFHELYDSNRGATKKLRSNNSSEEATQSDGLTDFTASGGGFSLGAAAGVNESNKTYVGWNWKANGSTTSTNADGDVDGTVQANPTAGFSIITYVANNSNSTTVGHGLSIKPDIMFQKNRSVTSNWLALHQLADGTLDYHLLDSVSGGGAGAQPVATTSTVATWKSSGSDTTGNLMVAYVFASIEGYSKMGSYITDAANSGPFVYTGFKPAWVMVKVTGGSSNSSYWSWTIYDNKRIPFNTNHSPLYANSNVSENYRGDESTSTGGNTLYFDFLSNGFKVMNGGTEANGTAGTVVIYMAFAEAPFKYANAK